MELYLRTRTELIHPDANFLLVISLQFIKSFSIAQMCLDNTRYKRVRQVAVPIKLKLRIEASTCTLAVLLLRVTRLSH